MANEFLPGLSISPAVFKRIAEEDQYNANIGGLSTNDLVGINANGNFIDFGVGSLNKIVNGALVNKIRMRQGAVVEFYDNLSNLLYTVNLGQATETVLGQAEIATQAEVDAGTDDLKFITPLKLASSDLIRVDKFLGPGNFTWVKPTGCKSIIVKLASAQGGGGAGNNINNGGRTIYYQEYGGRGIGVCMDVLITNPTPTVNMVLGAGGAGGAASALGATAGQLGGSSNFGSYITTQSGGAGGSGGAVFDPAGTDSVFFQRGNSGPNGSCSAGGLGVAVGIPNATLSGSSSVPAYTISGGAVGISEVYEVKGASYRLNGTPNAGEGGSPNLGTASAGSAGGAAFCYVYSYKRLISG